MLSSMLYFKPQSLYCNTAYIQGVSIGIITTLTNAAFMKKKKNIVCFGLFLGISFFHDIEPQFFLLALSYK